MRLLLCVVKLITAFQTQIFRSKAIFFSHLNSGCRSIHIALVLESEGKMSLKRVTELLCKSKTTECVFASNITVSNGTTYAVFDNGLQITIKRGMANSTPEPIKKAALKRVDDRSENHTENEIKEQIMNDNVSANDSAIEKPLEIKVSTKLCDVCKKRYQNRHKCRTRNLSKPKPGNSFSCDFCNEIFNTQRSRTQHYLIHFSETEATCPTCKTIVPGNELKKHFMSHEKRYRCTVCEKCFTKKGQLDIHRGVHVRKGMELCNDCPKIMYKKVDIENHKKAHTKEQRFICNVCKHESPNKYQLKLHLRKHSRIMPYRCDYCPARFRYRPSILHHLKEHPGKTDFTWLKSTGKKVSIRSVCCEICQRMFTSAGISKHYKKTHSEIMEYLTNID